MESLHRIMMEPPGGTKAGSGLSKGDPAQMDGIESDEMPRWIAGPAQLIGADGTFYDDAMDDVITNFKVQERLDHCTPYAIISVIGSQSTGRSSLLNSLFGVKFNNDDDSQRRNQSMKGIWLSRCAGPPLLIMDIEHSDAKEDDSLFDKQTVIFALTLSDLLVINMSLQEMNRDAGGNIHLLRTLLEERLNSKLDSGRIRMLILIHGCNDKLPLADLQKDVSGKLQKLWASIHSSDMNLSEFFEVLVVGLPDIKSKPQDFEEKIMKMRRWLCEEDIPGLKKDRILAQGFSLSAKGIWEAIRQKKQLGVFLFSHKINVSDTICGNIAREILLSLSESNEDILSLNNADRATSKEFTEKLRSILEVTLTRFDTETQLCDEDMRQRWCKELEKGICQLLESTCKVILVGLRMKIFHESKQEISNQLSEAEDPTSGINDAVQVCITKFLESCEGLSSKYSNLFNEHRVALEFELNAIAEIIANNIKEKRKREEAECAKAKAELEAMQTRETAHLKIEQYKREVANARSEIKEARLEAECAKEDSKQISIKSIEEIQRISQLAKADTERVKKELEIVKEEQRMERERAKEAAKMEASRQKNQIRLGMVCAVVVVAVVVVFNRPNSTGKG